MNRRDIIIGGIVLVIIAGIVYFTRRPRQPQIEVSQTPTAEEKLEDRFQTQIPEDVDKAELEDVAGETSTGIATRKYESGKFSHAVLADLPDPKQGEFYEGWLVRGKQGDANFAFISTGKMRVAKGGFVLEFSSNRDYTEYDQVVITIEAKDDKLPEKHILEGSF